MPPARAARARPTSTTSTAACTATTTSTTAASRRTTTSRTTTRASRCRPASSSISPTSTPRDASRAGDDRRYLEDLLSLGVDGFRIDAAKHMAAADVAGDRRRASRGNPDHQRGHPRRRRADPARGVRRLRRGLRVHVCARPRPAGAERHLTDPAFSDRARGMFQIRLRRRLHRQPRHRARRGGPHLPRRRPVPDGERPMLGTTTARPSSTRDMPSATGMPARRPMPTDAWRNDLRGRHPTPPRSAEGPHLRARVDRHRGDAGMAGSGGRRAASTRCRRGGRVWIRA